MKYRRILSMESLHNPDISEGVIRYITRGLSKQEKAQFRAYHVMQSYQIAFTPTQKEIFNRLKIKAQLNRQ
jgi:hypothetical protein